jgi:probable F420-dependent oxidoreductase
VLHPFRFGLHFSDMPIEGWAERARSYERLGFATITLTDHLVVPQWEPVAALGAIAAVTERIRVGTLVLDTALRNPVLTAKSAATIDRLSGGRFELGLGAGYVAANFAAAGLPFEPAADRVARLAETVSLVQRLWSEPSTTVHGRFYNVTDSPMVAPAPVRPRLLIGGGGRTVMHLGGRVADTVSIIPRQTSGTWSVVDSLPDSTVARMTQKATWVREGVEAARRDPDAIELNTMVPTIIAGDHVGPAIAEEAAKMNVTSKEIDGSTLYLCGSGPELRDKVRDWRDRTGISYISLFDPGEEQIAYLAEQVVAPLTAESPTDR